MNPQSNPNTMDYKKLHKHIAKRYDIYLFEDEIKEIVRIVLEMHNEDPEKCTVNTNCKVEIGMLYGQRVYVCKDQSKNQQITIK